MLFFYIWVSVKIYQEFILPTKSCVFPGWMVLSSSMSHLVRQNSFSLDVMSKNTCKLYISKLVKVSCPTCMQAKESSVPRLRTSGSHRLDPKKDVGSESTVLQLPANKAVKLRKKRKKKKKKQKVSMCTNSLRKQINQINFFIKI